MNNTGNQKKHTVHTDLREGRTFSRMCFVTTAIDH